MGKKREGPSTDHEIGDGEEQLWHLDRHVTCQGVYINAFQLVPVVVVASGVKECCWFLPMSWIWTSREICWAGCVGQSYKRRNLWHHTLARALSTLMAVDHTESHTCGSSK